ncbi:glutamine-rich protein 2-like [Patagioenas fasciata]|uniref:glutamine-rich protein 2-like n=1 Tax=Patagioenas fasciata TaxID=372321 RepID=UPI003A99AEC2
MPFLEVSDGLGRQGVLGWGGGQLRPCRGVTGCCLPWKALSQALGRLKKQKADKEQLLVLGIDEKADKAALADKVSRSQFEACVERLNNVMEDVTSRVTGQEESWHRFQKELQRQMDCKLDRRELGAYRQQQEERWKSLSGQQLQEKALQPERDNAAGTRKQLLPGFHCLSCDRPVNMLAPGP